MCHPDYEIDQKPDRRWFAQSHESRVMLESCKENKKYGCTGVLSLRMFIRERIGGGGESHQSTIMFKVHWYCHRSSLWQLVCSKVQDSQSSRTRVHVLHLGEAILPTPYELTSQPIKKT